MQNSRAKLLNREDFDRVRAAAFLFLIQCEMNLHAGPFREEAAIFSAECLRSEINKLAGLRKERAETLAEIEKENAA
jgi:hypothetical protein